MSMATEKTVPLGVVVGAGSIGRRHAQALARRCERMIVIDPSADARRWVEAHVSAPITTAAALEPALEGVTSEASQAIAVIANWGPDHAETFHTMVDAGFTRLLCEKPLAHSPQAAWQIAQRAEREGLRLTFGMYLHYAGLPAFLTSELAEHAGGDAVMVSVHGGAQCLVTNGIHFLDLACGLFGEEPRAVWAEAVDGRINPRSPDLGFWAGTAVWSFSNGRSASISLSNHSSVSSAMHVYGPTGRIDLASVSGLDRPISVGSRDPREIARDPRVTRVGDLATIKTYRRGFAHEPDATERQFDELMGTMPLSYPPSRAAAVLEATLAALASSDEGRRIALPLSPEDPIYHREWAAS
jgi:predicted dehydrogenase